MDTIKVLQDIKESVEVALEHQGNGAFKDNLVTVALEGIISKANEEIEKEVLAGLQEKTVWPKDFGIRTWKFLAMETETTEIDAEILRIFEDEIPEAKSADDEISDALEKLPDRETVEDTLCILLCASQRFFFTLGVAVGTDYDIFDPGAEEELNLLRKRLRKIFRFYPSTKEGFFNRSELYHRIGEQLNDFLKTIEKEKDLDEVKSMVKFFVTTHLPCSWWFKETK